MRSIWPSCARAVTGSAGHRGNASTYLPGTAHLEGQTPCISPSVICVMAQPWPGLLPPPAQAPDWDSHASTPKPAVPRSPASARPGGTASPGLAGSEGGSSPVGRGGRARRGLSPSDTHPLPPPTTRLCQHPAQPSPASQATTPSPPAQTQHQAGPMAKGWDHLDAGVLPSGSPFTWARRFICKEKT